VRPATARRRLGPGRGLLAAVALAALAGCATTGHEDPADPFEGFNRSVYSFNDTFDRAIAKPVATAYTNVVPAPTRGWVRNFFSNIADLFIGVNDMLSGKPIDAATDWMRFAVNSTIGIFGMNDVATDMRLEKHTADFGLTFGHWGAGPGPYLVWPILGSSDARDSVGKVLDWYADPVTHVYPIDVRYGLIVLRATSDRADLLAASRLLEEAALDKYAFQRDAYLQHRRSLIYGGHPPREKPPSQQQPEPAPNGAAPAAGLHADSDAAPAEDSGPKARVAAVYEPRMPANYQEVLTVEDAR
jgi:phospholipid-binding lipoprotein MlaA